MVSTSRKTKDDTESSISLEYGDGAIAADAFTTTNTTTTTTNAGKKNVEDIENGAAEGIVEENTISSIEPIHEDFEDHSSSASIFATKKKKNNKKNACKLANLKKKKSGGIQSVPQIASECEENLTTSKGTVNDMLEVFDEWSPGQVQDSLRDEPIKARLHRAIHQLNHEKKQG